MLLIPGYKLPRFPVYVNRFVNQKWFRFKVRRSQHGYLWWHLDTKHWWIRGPLKFWDKEAS